MADIKNLKVNLDSKILQSEKVVIVPHRNADVDAIGSAIGLSLIAKKNKKSSYIILDDPSYIMERGVKAIQDESKKDYNIVKLSKYLENQNSNDLFILTDVNKKNLISINEEMLNPKNTMIIDHHHEDDMTIDTKYKYINTDASSASEIVAQLLFQYRIKIPTNVANYLLAGIWLDTNKLYKNSSAETLRTMAKLVEFGADTSYADDLLSEDIQSIRRVNNLVSKLQVSTFSIATALGNEDDEYTREEIAKAADYLLRGDVDAAFAVGNIDDNTISVSARSKARIDVGAVMSKLGGGGNKFAAATKLDRNETTVEEVGEQLKKVLTPGYYIKR